MKMERNSCFGGWETGCVIANLLIYRIFTQVPLTFTRYAGPAAFLSALVSAGLGLILIWLLLEIIKRNSGRNLIDIAGMALGRFGRYVVFALIMVYALLSAIFTLQEFSELIKLIAFPKSPIWYVKLFLIVAGLSGAFLGLRATVRVHRIFVPALIGITLLVVFSAMEYGTINNVFPILGKGTEGVLRGGISGTLLYSDIILILLLNPFRGDFRKLKRTTLGALAASLLVGITVVFALSFTFPYPSSEELHFPVYSLLKEVWYGRFFQRIDVVYMFFISVCSMLYLSFLLGTLSEMVKNVAEAQTGMIYTIPLSLTVLIFCLCEDIRRYFTERSLQLCAAIVVAAVFLIAIIASGRCKKAHEKG